MGEEIAYVWSDDLRRTGRVVFGLRPRTVVVRVFAPAAFLGIFTVVGIVQDLGLGAPERILDLARIAAAIALIGIGGWQLVTGRPAVLVDHEGVRVGRRKLVPWSVIHPIRIPQGQGVLTEVCLPRRDPPATKLTIGRDHVADIPAFARCLEERRTSLW